MSGLRVGVVGVGRIGAFHVRTLLRLERVAAVLVADAVPEHARAVAAEHGLHAAGSPEALLGQVDALVIATLDRRARRR